MPDAELTNDSDGGSDERDGAVEPAEDAGDAEDASVETPDNGASGPDTADDVPVPDSGPTTQPSGGEDEGCEGGRYYYPNISAASESGAFIARIADVAEDPASPGWFTLTVQLFEDTGDWAAGRSLRMTIVVPGFETVDVGLQETERPGIYVTPGSFALPAADRWVLTVQVSASSDGAVLDEVEFVLCQGTQ